MSSLKNTEIEDYVFVLVPGVGYRAASNCPQLLTKIALSSRRGMIFASCRLFVWNSGNINARTPGGHVVAAAFLLVVPAAAFAIAGLLFAHLLDRWLLFC